MSRMQISLVLSCIRKRLMENENSVVQKGNKLLIV